MYSVTAVTVPNVLQAGSGTRRRTSKPHDIYEERGMHTHVILRATAAGLQAFKTM